MKVEGTRGGTQNSHGHFEHDELCSTFPVKFTHFQGLYYRSYLLVCTETLAEVVLAGINEPCGNFLLCLWTIIIIIYCTFMFLFF